MKQAPLFRREKQTLPAKQKAAQVGQLEAARIILADPKSEGIHREWAQRVIAKSEAEARM